ncbi:PREDICTED: uncharacterized protein LOC108362975 isoform X1 [Rhagoletis zephyria]|uniref:uncharacterized protein LOC108362975 isoform X1 n=1 Tax=Rhagoletis zephyria TaxID=28612 RepID=UPI0008117D2A|nr:PREDICTED: uncharacterized protein LOC108362975 isoform X1 [Rhagoletis zephyria]XP_017471634.1 PREDICTED: uncharacterized protein LOC108362975 isoform X1 [Rhagoletis zephyria]
MLMICYTSEQTIYALIIFDQCKYIGIQIYITICFIIIFFTEQSQTWILTMINPHTATPHKYHTAKVAMEEMVEFVEEAPITGAITPAGKKRKRVEESHERFDRLCGSIEAVIASKARYTDSDNSAFLQMLDECLKKKPDHVRERLKIELLTHAYIAN